MRKISILVPLHDNFILSQLCLEDAIKKTGLHDFEILIFNNCSNDSRIKSWVKDFAIRKGVPEIRYFESETVVRNSIVLNTLLTAANNEYICIIPHVTFLPDKWLFELLCANMQIPSSGICAISDKTDKGDLSPRMTEDESFMYVFQPESNMVNGVIFFHKSIIDQIGGFDPGMNQGYEYFQFAYRVSKVGLLNYYICGKTSNTPVQALDPINYFQTTNEDFWKNISVMAEKKDWTYKITQMADDEKNGRAHLPELMQKFKSIIKKEFYLELSESWGFEIIGFSQEESKYLDEFCDTHNLTWIVLPNKFLKNGISINFFSKK